MVSYIPVLTTLFSVFFLSRIVPHYLAKRSPYLLWWTLGVLTFGLGTLTESINAIFGWSEWNTKIWYIVGALLGGYPLAQGTIYLLMNKRFADISALVCSAVIVVAAVCVLSSPIEIPEGFDHRLTGRVFAWQWVRAFSPLLNLYAFVFLFGGAVYSAIQYFAKEKGRARVSSATSSLPLARFFPASAEASPASATWRSCTSRNSSDLSFIYFGYHMMRKDHSASLHANQQDCGKGRFRADPRAT